MKTFRIEFNDRDKYEDVVLEADQITPVEPFVSFITWHGEKYSAVSYSMSQIHKIEEGA